MTERTVADVPERERYELHVGCAQAGFVRYHLAAGNLELPHTEIDPSYSGRGLGSWLVRYVLDDARRRGLPVLPYCTFVRGVIARHPEYTALVPESRRADFGLAATARADRP